MKITQWGKYFSTYLFDFRSSNYANAFLLHNVG